jgi:DNA-binding CsgD family transcriptional regulator
LIPASLTSPEWTPGEDAILVGTYGRGGIKAAAAALPARSTHAIYRRANRLGLKRRAVWTPREDEELRELWAEGLSLPTICSRLGRSQYGVYWHAYKLGLTSDVPPGFESLHDAAKRTGYDTKTLEKILAWAGKKVRVSRARPRPGKPAYRYKMVDWISVDDALEAWHRTEPATTAARRLGVNADRFRERLAKVGVTSPGWKKHLRVTPEQVAAANAVARPRRLRELGAGGAA